MMIQDMIQQHLKCQLNLYLHKEYAKERLIGDLIVGHIFSFM